MGCTCTSAALHLDSRAIFTFEAKAISQHRNLKARFEADDFTVNCLQRSIATKAFALRHVFPSFRPDFLLDSGNSGNDDNNNNNNNGNGNNNDNDSGSSHEESRGGNLYTLSLFWTYRLTSVFSAQVWHSKLKMGEGLFSPSQFLLCLLSVVGFFHMFHIEFASALGSIDETERIKDEEVVWEIKGSQRKKLIPDFSKDEFVVAPSSFWTSSSASFKGDINGGNLNSSVGLPSLWLLCKDIIFRLMLPEGFPDSVTSDYLDYSLWRGVQGIASQISGVLATQSLLFAVGLGKGVIPTAAAINWVLKDGIGYLSKIVLSKFGRHFDVHPKGWRLFADLMENAAFGLEILTPTFPHLFVFIGATAGAGRSAATLIQAATRSCFYAGFAAKRNFAEVIAKGEAQGMVSKSIGIMLGIALANAVGSSTSLSLACFGLITWVHMYCNLKSYQSIQLRTLNPYRASLVFSEYLLSGQVPSVKDVNDEEPLFPAMPFLNLRPPYKPNSSNLSIEAKNAAAEIERRLELGSTCSDVIQRREDVVALFNLYRNESYILTECNGKFCVILKESASPQDMLRSLYQINFLYWLETNAGIKSKNVADDCRLGGKLQVSLDYVQREFDHVKHDSDTAGWVTDGLIARPLPHRICLNNIVSAAPSS